MNPKSDLQLSHESDAADESSFTSHGFFWVSTILFAFPLASLNPFFNSTPFFDLFACSRTNR